MRYKAISPSVESAEDDESWSNRRGRRAEEGVEGQREVAVVTSEQRMAPSVVESLIAGLQAITPRQLSSLIGEGKADFDRRPSPLLWPRRLVASAIKSFHFSHRESSEGGEEEAKDLEPRSEEIGALQEQVLGLCVRTTRMICGYALTLPNSYMARVFIPALESSIDQIRPAQEMSSLKEQWDQFWLTNAVESGCGERLPCFLTPSDALFWAREVVEDLEGGEAEGGGAGTPVGTWSSGKIIMVCLLFHSFAPIGSRHLGTRDLFAVSPEAGSGSSSALGKDVVVTLLDSDLQVCDDVEDKEGASSPAPISVFLTGKDCMGIPLACLQRSEPASFTV